MATPALLPGYSVNDASPLRTAKPKGTPLNVIPAVTITPLTYVSVSTDTSGAVALIFSENVNLGNPATLASDWTITSASGITVQVTSVAVANATVTLQTTGHTNGVTYTVNIPRYGIISVAAGLNLSGSTFAPTYVGASTTPSVSSAVALDGDEFQITFSKPMVETEALSPQNYAITGGAGLTVSTVTKMTPQTYRIKTTAQQAAGTTYTVTVSNVHDLLLNPLS